MGDFRFTLEAAGGHCCQQDTKEGDVYGCGHFDCPDCKARRLVRELVAGGYNVHKATIEHWPAGMVVDGQLRNYTEAGQVTDDLKAMISSTGLGPRAQGPVRRQRGKAIETQYVPRGSMRQARIDLASPSEAAIREAIAKVESMGADPRLTAAVVALGNALSHVGGYVDEQVKGSLS
jgi:hypothetical protein